MIHENVKKLCNRISEFSGSKTPINIGAAISAFTRDISNEFIRGKSYNNLDHQDFNIGMLTRGGGYVRRITKHVPWFGPVLMSIPTKWTTKVADPRTKAFLNFIKASYYNFHVV